MRENPIPINPCAINELDNQIKTNVLEQLNSKQHSEKLKRATPFQVNNQWYFFTHSVAVVKPEQDSEDKSFFIASRKFEVETLSGSFGSVKPVTRFFSAENQQITYDQNPWLRKRTTDQELLQDEYENTKIIAPNLHMHYPVQSNQQGNNYKGQSFMKNVGCDLTRLPNNSLDKNKLAKILKDVTKQAQTAAANNIFLSDIKLENIVYDVANNQATIIDLSSICFNPRFRAPECSIRDRSEIDIEKAMIYSIGISLYEVANKQFLYAEFQEIILLMINQNPVQRPAFAEIIQLAERVLNPENRELNLSQ